MLIIIYIQILNDFKILTLQRTVSYSEYTYKNSYLSNNQASAIVTLAELTLLI